MKIITTTPYEVFAIM